MKNTRKNRKKKNFKASKPPAPKARAPRIKIQHHGFVPDEITDDNYVLGAYTKLEKQVLMPGGHGWAPFLPIPEVQNKNGLETMNCTNYGTHNCWETVLLRKFNMRFDASERYSGVMTGTTKGGNSPHKVAEIIRNEAGMIAEILLPFDGTVKTWEQYYSPNPMKDGLKEQGRAFLAKFALGHEWVFKDGSVSEKQAKLKEALQYSPLGVSVVAWKERDGLYFKEDGDDDNHWCMLYDYEEGKRWMIFDHYDLSLKDLEWDYDFGQAKLYTVDAAKAPVSTENPIIAFLRSMWNAIIRPKLQPV